jgi:two-component system cell cycle response regulator DivK
MNEAAVIIIIDDDKRNIFALKTVLKSKGFSCLSAQSFNEGLAIIQQNPQLRLIMMDMMMPEIDGYQSIALLKNDANFKVLPIIAITAQAMTGDEERCIAAGADGYVSKPVNIDQLMVYVNKFIVNA